MSQLPPGFDYWKLGSQDIDAPDSDFEEDYEPDYEPDYIGEFPKRKEVDDGDV